MGEAVALFFNAGGEAADFSPNMGPEAAATLLPSANTGVAKLAPLVAVGVRAGGGAVDEAPPLEKINPLAEEGSGETSVCDFLNFRSSEPLEFDRSRAARASSGKLQKRQTRPTWQRK